MLNQSEFLTSIKMDLGLYGLTLPFEDVNDTIMQTIRLKTIPTFSIFIPEKMRLDMDLATMKKIKNNYEESIYQLPDVFGDRKIISIINVEQRNNLLGSTFEGPLYNGGIDLYHAALMGQANMNLFSTIAPPFTFRFEQPNKLYLYNTNTMTNNVTIDFALEHMPNLSTIKNTTWESFMELAVIDVKKFMYNTLKHYKDIQSAFGTITLKIDDWENADSERKELIERWKDVYHLDLPAYVIV
ncbi:hypothetical protein D1872_38310 [compost metagenome]